MWDVHIVQMSIGFLSDAWVRWLNNQEITRYSEQRHHKHTLDTQKSFLLDKLQDANSKLFAILVNEKHVGNLELYKLRPSVGSQIHPVSVGKERFIWECKTEKEACLELSYMIGDKAYWGKGVATEAIGAATKLAFSDYDADHVAAFTELGNLGSNRVLIKNGFKPIFEHEDKSGYSFMVKERKLSEPIRARIL